jgi:hypothetical protein
MCAVGKRARASAMFKQAAEAWHCIVSTSDEKAIAATLMGPLPN